jgi:hypothetical protein
MSTTATQQTSKPGIGADGLHGRSQRRPADVPGSRTRAQRPFASASVAAHLVRGAIGFATIGLAIALAATVSPAALLLAPFGMVALRGCPTCWTVGLIQTIGASRGERNCDATGCSLRARGAEPAELVEQSP